MYEPVGFEAGYDGYSTTEEVCDHQWVGGMCIVHPEDLEYVMHCRDGNVECDKCGVTPIKGVNY